MKVRLIVCGVDKGETEVSETSLVGSLLRGDGKGVVDRLEKLEQDLGKYGAKVKVGSKRE